MKLRLCACFPIVVLGGVVLAFVLGPMRASGQEVPASSDTKQENLKVVPKPTRKPDWVTTNDPIALLAVRREPSVSTAEGSLETKGSDGSAAAMRKAAEIALVEQQIREKQKRIAFLLRLFVDDERTFLNDPGNAAVVGAAAERRQYEQDELKWETAELAKLKAREREMTAGR